MQQILDHPYLSDAPQQLAAWKAKWVEDFAAWKESKATQNDNDFPF